MRVLNLHAFCTFTLASSARRFSSVAHDEEVAALAEPHVDLHLTREVATDADALLHEAHVRLGRPLCAHAAAVAPARAAAEIAAVDDGDLRHTKAREVVGDRKAHDPRADDDDVRFAPHGAHRSMPEPHRLRDMVTNAIFVTMSKPKEKAIPAGEFKAKWPGLARPGGGTRAIFRRHQARAPRRTRGSAREHRDEPSRNTDSRRRDDGLLAPVSAEWTRSCDRARYPRVGMVAHEAGEDTAKAMRAIRKTPRIGIAAISVWEIAAKAERGKLKFNRPYDFWLEEALTADARAELLHLSPRISIEAARLSWTTVTPPTGSSCRPHAPTMRRGHGGRSDT